MLRLACFPAVFLVAGFLTVVQPEARLTRRIVFVVDTSGSMRGNKFGQACSAVLRVAQQPVDEVEIALIAFNHDTRRWPGVPEEGIPPGWAALPSLQATESAAAFLAQRGAGGDTQVITALRQALAEPRDELSIVLVTDGLFVREKTEDVLKAFEDGQKERAKKKLAPAVLLVYGIGRESDVLRELGTRGRGGYLREVDDADLLLPTIAPAIQGTVR
ncbi:MAG: VWA domain-containing protein [Planctomycetota bacterium]